MFVSLHSKIHLVTKKALETTAPDVLVKTSKCDGKSRNTE